MSTFRIEIHNPASNSIHLELEDGSKASNAVRGALRRLGDAVVGVKLEDRSDRDLQGWRLRARRSVEEGRWWTEEDIKGYSDRKSDLF